MQLILQVTVRYHQQVCTDIKMDEISLKLLFSCKGKAQHWLLPYNHINQLLSSVLLFVFCKLLFLYFNTGEIKLKHFHRAA